MSVFWAAFQAVTVLLGIGWLGFWMARRRMVRADALGAMQPLALEVALPCMVFSAVLLRFDPQAQPGWWRLPLWWAGFMVFGLVMAGAAALAARPGARREAAMCVFLNNAVFFPTVLLAGLRGPNTPLLADLFLFTLFFHTLFLEAVHFFFPRAGAVNWRRLVSPVLIATLAALVIRLARAQGFVPSFIVESTRLVGGMAVPLLMIILGGALFLDFEQRGRFEWIEAAKFVAVKNFLCPLAMVGLLWLVRPAPGVALLLLLQSAAPPITAAVVLVERGGGDRRLAGQYVLASFLAALVSTPAAMWLAVQMGVNL